MQTLVAQLRSAAAKAPQARIHDGALAPDYTELHERSLRVAGGLARQGIGEGDRVALWLPNGLAYLDLVHACHHLGAVAVAINTRFRTAEAQSILQRTGARALAIAPGFKDIAFLDMLAGMDRAALPELRLIVSVGEELHDALSGATSLAHRDLLAANPVASRADPELPVAIFATSGTTNAPKFALHRQGNIALHGARIAAAFGFDAGDAHLLQAVPFCGIWGFSQWMGTVAGAASASLVPFFEARGAGTLIRERGITHLSGPDDLIQRLFDAFPEQRPFPTLREALISTFNPTLGEFTTSIDQRGLRMVNGYGMSEIFSFFSRRRADDPPPLRQRPGGTPLDPQAELRVRSTTGDALLGIGEVGRLELKVDTLFSGYFGDPAATAAAFTPDGFFRTGDLAALGPGGTFDLVGRDGDFLRLGGFLVNPVEIEDAVKQAAPGCEVVVVEAATARGNKPVAFMRAGPGIAPPNAAVLTNALRGRIADFKVPVRIVPLEAFPVAIGPNGEKIQRHRLRAMAASLLEASDPNSAESKRVPE
ncbi:AMP-binding domain-containing protein [Hyphomicrobiales bacterium]|nr:AMP-binding domain-containing protein [Hyphomicrobiales bacterium]CAH1697465.1 AMP-binding domain-containing protein [Hyphomicrobiales bacterium]CAI0345653.1 AMP-binding domain-containing protein [Hyphomicrobiales bacterium]